LLNAQIISELQNYLYRRITAGWQSDMHGRCEEDTVDRSPSCHIDSSSSPNYFKTEEKSEFEPAYSHYYVGEWYFFPVFAIVTITGALFQSYS